MTSNETLQDRYELLERIGSGGMAEVWRARDKRLEREVAVKFLNDRLLGNPESHVRFFSEAQAAARISHPHVVGVLDFGRSEDVPYLVMEYVPGGTIADLLGEPMDVDEGLSLVAQAAEGAGILHASDLVHRDLKPANLLLDRSGSVRVTDLGIAAAATAEHLTDTGAAIGSPHYISPEQVSGKEATPASDVYSLGVVLYEALTGRKPFDGESVTAIAIAHVDRTPEPPSSHRPDLAPEIDALVMRCLAKDPEMRFENGAALATAIDALDPLPSTSAAIGPLVAVKERASAAKHELDSGGGRSRSTFPAGAVLVGLLLLAGGVLVAARLGEDPAAVAGSAPSPAATKSGEGSPSPSPSDSPSDAPAVSEDPAPSPSETPGEEKKSAAGDAEQDDPEDEPEPSPEPTSEPSPEPSPEPTTESTSEEAPEPSPSP